MKSEREDRQILARTYYGTLPDENITSSKGEATPNVSEKNVLIFKNTGAQAITNILGGRDGQNLRILGDGQTTLDNNANIKTSTGANKLLSLTIYEFTFLTNVWYEHAT